MTTEQTLTYITPLINDLIAAGCPPLPEWCILTPHAYRIYGPVWKHDCDGSVENSDAVLAAVTTWVMGEVVPWDNDAFDEAHVTYQEYEGVFAWEVLDERADKTIRGVEIKYSAAVLALLRAIHGVVCGEVKA